MTRILLRYGLAAWLACSAVAGAWSAAADESKEYLVKAAFIYNFVKFVEWPGGKAIAQQSHIDICVVGSSAMVNTSSVFKAASTAKLSLSLVKESSASAAASHCHIVFIAASEEGRLTEMLGELQGKPVLTVSDMDGFAEKGGMIGFVPSDNKVKVVVNTKPVGAAGMRVDAQLLEIALKVIDR